MRKVFRWAMTVALVLSWNSGAWSDAGANPKVDQLIGFHNLDTSVSIGNYYLKQESLLCARALLTRVGEDQKLGADWNPGNRYWQRAESALVGPLMGRVQQDFSNLEWLKPQWTELGRQEFSDHEIDVLLAHFRSATGRKQVQIVDHTVSTHVMMALSFSGKLKDVPGAEPERTRMQALWNDEDGQMRFSIEDSRTADGQAFALSPLGKKYFVTAILKLTGLLNRRIEDVAAELPMEAARHGDAVRPFVEEFKSAHG